MSGLAARLAEASGPGIERESPRTPIAVHVSSTPSARVHVFGELRVAADSEANASEEGDAKCALSAGLARLFDASSGFPLAERLALSCAVARGTRTLELHRAVAEFLCRFVALPLPPPPLSSLSLSLMYRRSLTFVVRRVG